MAFEAFVLPRYLRSPTDARQAPLTPRRPGLFLRLVQAVMASRQQAADREIARIIELRGGKVTDELDRRIDGSRL